VNRDHTTANIRAKLMTVENLRWESDFTQIHFEVFLSLLFHMICYSDGGYTPDKYYRENNSPNTVLTYK